CTLQKYCCTQLDGSAHRSKKQGPVLPPRPNPGHRLYNKYIVRVVDHKTFECQVGDVRGRVQKSHITVITPLASMPPPQVLCPSVVRESVCVPLSHSVVLHVCVLPSEGPGELGLRVGDVVTNVEQVDNDWYRGTCRGYTGFFPINYVKVLLLICSHSQYFLHIQHFEFCRVLSSGPRCVARFDFDGEHSDELSFSEGDVIQLKEYVGQEWARGKVGVFMGIFPLNFVEVIEDLPPPPSQQQTPPTKIALPGKTTWKHGPKAVNPFSAIQSKAVNPFTSESDLSFQQGDCILITRHVDADWYCGRLSGREGLFPKAFNYCPVEPSRAAGIGTAKALYDFTSDCDEELSLQAGDIITNLESIDDEWFLGDLKGKRALVPKNYVQVLEMH
uniref:SH3 domain-containing protein n=1 Tax=Myripristis murdjan TaxID=586833 RepID=A0A667XBN3_9TELE